MGTNNVVSIRVEALGVSITIADGSIAIEQTKTEIPAAAVLKAEGPVAAPSAKVPINTSVDDRAPALTGTPRDSSTAIPATDWGDSGWKTAVIDEVEQTPYQSSPPGSNGPTDLPGDSDKGQDARSTQTKPLWSDEEVEKLRALYPTHSASAIAEKMGRNAVRSEAQNLGLRKDGPPTVTSRSAKPAPKPRPLSAAVTGWDSLTGLPGEDAVLKGQEAHGFSAVSLFDPGQCRWMISDVWPVIYCGAPVVDSSSWCEQHSKRVFNFQPRCLAGISRRFR